MAEPVQRYDLLLYDLTSTYFECDPPETSESKKRFGYSRDRRPDCVQVVIGLVITPQGFPLGYEIFPGNTRDTSTLRAFLDRIESQYGKMDRLWLMDRGIPTEETLRQMRTEGALYLVGTPKGRLSKLEKKLLQLPWHQAREQVRVKLLETEGEFYLYVESADRLNKERSLRRRRLRRLLMRLKEIQRIKRQSRDELLLRLGEARKLAGRTWYLVEIHLPEPNALVSPETFTFRLNRDKLRRCRRREGRYLLRSNLTGQEPAQVWQTYLLLTHVEQAFKELKGDMSVRPIYHQKEKRIEAHIFVSFLSYCLFVTLRNRLKPSAKGLTSRSFLEIFQQIQMVDVHLPTTDGRTILLQRYTEPSPEVQLLLDRLGMRLPNQPPPRIYGQEENVM